LIIKIRIKKKNGIKKIASRGSMINKEATQLDLTPMNSSKIR